MKVAIFGNPRTGSTKMSLVMSNIFRINYIQEVLTGTSDLAELMKLATNLNESTDSFVAKFFAENFVTFPINAIQWSKFDLVIVTTRDSLVDTYISRIIALQRNNWIKRRGDSWSNDQFTINVDNITAQGFTAVGVQSLPRMVAEIKQLAPLSNVITVNYDEINNDGVLLNILQSRLGLPYNLVVQALNRIAAGPLVPTGINYREKCLNYTEVETKFKELGLI